MLYQLVGVDLTQIHGLVVSSGGERPSDEKLNLVGLRIRADLLATPQEDAPTNRQQLARGSKTNGVSLKSNSLPSNG